MNQARKRVVRGISAAIAASVLAPADASGVLYFTDLFAGGWETGWVRRVSTDGTSLHTIACPGGGVRGVAIDPIARKLYWTDVEADVIRRANLDGTEPEDIVTTNVDWPLSIDLHVDDGQMYWTDQSLHQVVRANLDGSGMEVLHRFDPATGLFGIAIDAVHGKLYWAMTVSLPGQIARSNLDGSNMEFVVTLDKPSMVAVDPVGGKIYWTDVAANAVRRSNLDGLGIEDLFFVGDAGNSDGIVLNLEEGKVYWAQDEYVNHQNIMRMNLDGSEPEFVAGLFGGVVEIALIPEAPPLCLGDVDAGGAVDILDLLTLLASWGPCAVPCPTDVNTDGVVAIDDLCVLLANWGLCP